MSETETTWPAWLPDLLDINGVPSLVFAHLYSQFRLDFLDLTCYFRGSPIHCDRRKQNEDDYEEGFWHLVSRDDYATQTRLHDARRAEKLAWCAAVIANADDECVSVWNYLEGRGQKRTYLWLRDWDYVVILEWKKNRSVYQLVTAFHVDEQKRHDLESRYRRSQGN